MRVTYLNKVFPSLFPDATLAEFYLIIALSSSNYYQQSIKAIATCNHIARNYRLPHFTLPQSPTSTTIFTSVLHKNCSFHRSATKDQQN